MRRAALLSVVLCTLCLAGPATAEEGTPAERLAALDWLEGTWRGDVGPGVWEAVYSSPSGGEVHSSNKEIRGGRVVSFEFERFFVDGDAVVMTPYVKGVLAVPFSLTTLDREARRAVFENPEHDFPQRIEYHRAADDRLVISVTAERDGRQRGFRLDLARVDKTAAEGGAPPPPPVAVGADGAGTPTDLLARLATAARARDTAGFVACVAPEERVDLSWAMGVMLPQYALMMGGVSAEAVEALGDDATEARGALAQIKARYDALLAKYGLEALADPEVAMDPERGAGLLRDIDHGAFLGDALAVMQPYWDEHGAGDPSVRNPLLKFVVEVARVEQDGEISVVYATEAPDQPALKLKRRRGRWFLSIEGAQGR